MWQFLPPINIRKVCVTLRYIRAHAYIGIHMYYVWTQTRTHIHMLLYV